MLGSTDPEIADLVSVTHVRLLVDATSALTTTFCGIYQRDSLRESIHDAALNLFCQIFC